MVIDSLKNCAKYSGLNPHFAKAFYFIATNDLASLEPGRHEVDGDNVYANIVHGTLKPKEAAKLEIHNNYIDIQICIKGQETFGWIKREACVMPEGDYNSEKDILFLNDQETTYFTLNDGEFAIFFPEDGHTPMIGEGEIKKCIIKVRA
ncbi:MAG: YhcH/YjgK/YiaL family protein [Rikenellaceae bacterium]|nr:YhcH/YjgK/YiaL family protein [Rikenellaceae bacterium]